MGNIAETMACEWKRLTEQLHVEGNEDLEAVLLRDLSEAGMSARASEDVVEELKGGIKEFYENYDYLSQSRDHAAALETRLREALDESPLSLKEKYSVLARLKRMAMRIRLLCTSDSFAREGSDISFISQAVELEYEAEHSIEPEEEDYEAILEETSRGLCHTGIHCMNPQVIQVLEQYLETNDGIAFSTGVEEILEDERERILLKSYITYKLARFGSILPEETRAELDWDNPIIANITGQETAAEHEKEKCVANAVCEGEEERAAGQIELIGESLWLGMATGIVAAAKLACDTALVYGGQIAAEALTCALEACGMPQVAARLFSGALTAPIVGIGQKGLDKWKEDPQAVLRDIREFNRKAYDFLERRVMTPAREFVLDYGRKIYRCVTEGILPAVNRKWKAFADIVKNGREKFVISVGRAKEQIYRKAARGLERGGKAVRRLRKGRI